jgi:hypothetical protein
MNVTRWCGITYLSFLLWLLLFPPWMESHRTYLEGDAGQLVAEDEVFPVSVTFSLGHHWRFSIPRHWEWSPGDRQSFFVPNLGSQIDYRTMLYEAVIGLVALGLSWLAVSALVPLFRNTTA